MGGDILGPLIFLKIGYDNKQDVLIEGKFQGETFSGSFIETFSGSFMKLPDEVSGQI